MEFERDEVPYETLTLDETRAVLLSKHLRTASPPRALLAKREYRDLLSSKCKVVLEADPALEEGDPSRWCLILPKTSAVDVRCPNCGHAHRNPALITTYRVCHHCEFILARPDQIEIDPSWLLESTKLRILAASYGHPTNASLAVDVTRQLDRRVSSDPEGQLLVRATESLARLFLENDPCPGHRKALKVRYLMDARRGELTAFEGERAFYLETDLRVCTSKALPLVCVLRAEYGHPLGVIKGRGAIDVTDVLQARVHVANGRSLTVSRHEDLTKAFGEPCRGRAKFLTLEYEITGKAGEMYEYEMRGHLARPISIEACPSVAPQIMIRSATYGWTVENLAQRRHATQKKVFDLQAIQQKRGLGMSVSKEESLRLRELPALKLEMRELATLEPGHVDVCDQIQRRIEHCSGAILFLAGRKARQDVPAWARALLRGKEEFGIDLERVDDLNAIFGNPAPGRLKLLCVDYLVVGHDAERRTLDSDTTSTGFEANFISQREGQLAVAVSDDAVGRGLCDDSIVLGVPTVLPSIEVRYAAYGNYNNPSEMWDVTAPIKALCNAGGGKRIHISAEEDLDKLLGDPCRGIRKKLSIKYYVRGLRGCCRVDETTMNHLRTDLVLGFPPTRDGKINDPFEPTTRRNPRDASIERIQSLRRQPTKTGLSQSPYSHLGRAW